jgi:hypothetical protein
MGYFIKDVRDHIGEIQCPVERKVRNFLVDQQPKITTIKYFSIIASKMDRGHTQPGIKHVEV